MSTRTILLTPIDAWFFRDGRPYNQGESGQTDVRSLFPPFAPTVVGTLRAALAVGQGWNGRESWANELHPILGNGFDDLGQLQFHGPFLVRDGKCLFPVPLHLLGRAADDATLAKLFLVAFCVPGTESHRPRSGKRLGASSFSCSHRIEGPTWTIEGADRLVGNGGRLQQNSSRRIAGCRIVGSLHRLVEDGADELGWHETMTAVLPKKERCTARSMCGSCEELNWPRWSKAFRRIGYSLTSLRLAASHEWPQCESRTDELPLPQLPVDMIRESNRFIVSLLSPLVFAARLIGTAFSAVPGQSFPGLAGSTIVSACVGRPVQIGGWNSLKREPLPLIPYLPAGSTWFCEADPAALESTLALHGRHVGERTPYGFGQIALGAWPQETGDTA